MPGLGPGGRRFESGHPDNKRVIFGSLFFAHPKKKPPSHGQEDGFTEEKHTNPIENKLFTAAYFQLSLQLKNFAGKMARKYNLHL